MKVIPFTLVTLSFLWASFVILNALHIPLPRMVLLIKSVKFLCKLHYLAGWFLSGLDLEKLESLRRRGSWLLRKVGGETDSIKKGLTTLPRVMKLEK